MRDDIAALSDGLALDGPDMPKAGPNDLGPPWGTFVVGCEDQAAVCWGRLSNGVKVANNASSNAG